MSTELIPLRCNMYLLIARLLRDAPDAQLLNWLQEIDLFAEAEFEDEIEASAIPRINVPSMNQAWFELQQAANLYSEQEVAQEYQQLFIGIGRGEVVPFGSWHLSGALMEKPLVALRQDLQWVGIERHDNVKEPEDHLAALCEVMALLLESENETIHTFSPHFFNRHIASWHNALVEQLLQAPSTAFYRAVASFITAFLYIEQVKYSQASVYTSAPVQTTVKNHIDIS